MDIPNDCHGVDALSAVDEDLVHCGHGEHHPVRQLNEGRVLRGILLILLPVEIGVELNAGRMALDPREHECWLSHFSLEKAIDGILGIPLISLEISVYGGWCEEEGSICAPRESSYHAIDCNIN